MFEIMDVPSQPNFTMLSEYLHNLFRLYIINGRTRAPPESELVDLIPTFQQGAKTNRRALQSKFKSWAKRMEVENGDLVLASSGKIIVPEEKCDELIMNLHSDDHQPLDMVIFQILKKYSWTKKNFGMDTDMVVKVISAHCTKKECIEHSTNFFSRSTFVSERKQSRFFQPSPMRSSMMFTSKYKGWPVHLSSSKYFKEELTTYPHSSNNRNSAQHTLITPGYKSFNWSSYRVMNSVPQYLKYSMDIERKIDANYKQNYIYGESQSHSSEFVGETRNTVRTSTLQEKNNFLQSLELSRKCDIFATKRKKGSASEIGKKALEGIDSNEKRSTLMRSCKKIRNIFEFKKLLKIAESQPKSYPAVLVNPKTIFLGRLGLTPKRICSKKMLSKFSEELRKRQEMEKRSWFKGHKVLRDRNKLVMSKSQREKSERFPHLSMSHKTPQRTEVLATVRGKNTKRIERGNQPSSMSNIRFIGTQIKKQTPDDSISFLKDDVQIGRNENLVNKREEVAKSPSRNRMNTFDVLSKLKDSEVFEQSQMLRREEYKNISKSPSLNGTNDSKKSIGFQEIISRSTLYNSNLPQNYNVPYHFNNNSQLLVPFMGPLLIPVPSAPTNVAFLPHSNFPMIVRPLNHPPLKQSNFKKMISAGQKNVAKQSLQRLNTPPVFLVDNRKNTNSDIIPKSLNQSNPSRNNEVLIVNKTEIGGNVLFKPYRVLAPKNVVSLSSLKTPILGAKTKELKNSLPINVASRIESKKRNPLQNETIRDLPSINDCNINNSSSKDIDEETKKLTDWIAKMTKTVIPSTFGKGVEKYRLYLTAELNAGIDLVKDIRCALINIERNMNDNA